MFLYMIRGVIDNSEVVFSKLFTIKTKVLVVSVVVSFVFHMTELDSIPAIPYNPLNPTNLILQYSARSKPRAQLGVVQKLNKYKI